MALLRLRPRSLPSARLVGFLQKTIPCEVKSVGASMSSPPKNLAGNRQNAGRPVCQTKQSPVEPNVEAGGGIPLLAFLSLLLLASGCAHPALRQASTPASTARAGLTALADTGLKRFMEQQLHQPLEPWPLHAWDLRNLTLAACYFNPSIATARTQWRDAEMALAKAQGKSFVGVPDPPLFPPGKRPDLFASLMPEPVLPVLRDSASQAVNSAKRSRRLAEAARRVESARLRLQTVAWNVRASVRSNLVAYASLLQGETLLKGLEAAQAGLVELSEAHAAGSATFSEERLELSRLQLQLAQTRLVRTQTLLAKGEARMRLAQALSLPVGVLFNSEVAFDFSRRPALPGFDWAGLRWKALHNRRDMQEALAGYTDAEAVSRAEILKATPSAGFPPGCWWDPRASRWTVKFEPGLPADVRHGPAARAEARRIAAAARLLGVQAEILDEVEQSAAVCQAAAEDAARVDGLVSLLVRQYAAVEAHSEPGAIGAPEPLLARMQLLAAGLSKLDAQVKLQAALGSVENALQLTGDLTGTSHSISEAEAPAAANRSQSNLKDY